MSVITANLEETLPGKPTPVVLLFADVAGSTQLYDALGDTRGQNIVLASIAAMASVTAAYGGRVVKTIGDEVLCLFPRALDAVLAAGDMHRAIQKVNEARDMPLGPVRIQVGIHMGPALVERDDIFGDTVKITTAIVALAKPDQTLASGEVVRLLPPELGPSLRSFDHEVLSSRRRKVEIYEVLWEVGDTTDAASQPGLAIRVTHSRLTLEMGGREIALGEGHESAVLGRGEQCDIRYPSGLASRQHARIEYRRGRFALIDNSVNGTFVVDDTGKVVSVHRDELVLAGTGYITLGETPDRQGTPIVRYRCE